MASGGGGDLLSVTVTFQGNRSVLHLAKNIRVGQAVVKAAEQFKVKPEGLTFLYHGTEITDDMLVGDALTQAGSVTVIHLISVTDKKKSTAKLHVPSDGTKRETVYAFCKTCSVLVPAREMFTCPNCDKHQGFQRSSAEPLDHFAAEISPALLTGTCTICGKNDIQATVEFECTACSRGEAVEKVCPLRQVRDNKHNLPCMKCGLKKNPIFRLNCSSRHTFCLDCFGNMCKQSLGAERFRYFEHMGYSICCPGTGADCRDTPVPDPHHFRVVDDDQKFYKKFIDMSPNVITPTGSNILCNKCKIEIDVSDSREQTVTEPDGATPNVSGLKWYHKLFGLKPAPPPPRTRKRTTCRKCDLPYCIGCKQVWHEGDCLPVDQDRQKEESAFPIDPVKAKESCWPQDSN